MADWWEYGVGRAHDPRDNAGGGELGVDVSTPVGTPIRSPWAGTVTYVGMNSNTGGIVKIATNIPGIGPVYEYYLHLNQINVTRGQQINSSTVLGLSGGLQPGAGRWAHTEFGLFKDQRYANQYWGFQTGSTLDPTSVYDALRKGLYTLGQPPGVTPPANGPVAPVSSPVPIVGPIIDWLNQFTGQFAGTIGWLSNPIRILKLVAGAMTIVIASYITIARMGVKVAGPALQVAGAATGQPAVAASGRILSGGPTTSAGRANAVRVNKVSALAKAQRARTRPKPQKPPRQPKAPTPPSKPKPTPVYYGGKQVGVKTPSGKLKLNQPASQPQGTP